MLLNAFRRLFSNSKNRKARRAYTRPQLLQLESRIVPANFQVTSLADTATGGTLREAIDLANTTAGNDTIDFASSLFSGGAGTITLLTAQLPTILSASTAISGGTRGTLTITGPGASSLTISGNNGVSTRDFRIFEIVSGGNLSISGVTVSGAKLNSGSGGAFLNNRGTLSISNSILQENSSGTGGAISNQVNAILYITNSTLSNNSASSQGGAIHNYYGTSIVNISNSTLSNNSAGGGGAISNSDATLNISNSTLSNNSTTGGTGGAIYNIGNSTLSISYSTLSDNSALYNGTNSGVAGGAISNTSSGAISISNSTVSNNTSGTGGAISSTGTGNITISNSTLSNNSATLYGGGQGGGAIYIYNTNNPRPTLIISNSTLSNNSANYGTKGGGAINNDGAILSISNSTLSNNSATSASAIRGGGFFVNTIFANGTGVQFDVGGFTGTNNLVTSGTYSWATTVSRAPLNLGLLQNNGGPTQSIALLSGSVAIGAGDAAISNAAPISGKDQRGYSRSSTAPSIGAFEFNGAAPAPAPTITSISPVTGSAAGGNTLTITGTDFTGATAVTIGGVAASSFNVVNSTTITAVTPAHAAGAASVEVTTATGTNVANSLFTYAATTSTILTSSVNPSVFGQPIIFTATVTGSSGTPTGTITFKNGSTTLGTGTLKGSGVTTFSTSSLPVGSTHSITAEYGGDVSFVTSTSSTVSQVVNQASTTTALASSANPSLFGQAVTFSATVAATTPGAGTVAGSVEFFDGSISLGTVTLVSGSATSAAITNFGVSTHSITAVYSGDASFVTSTSSAVSQVVNKASSATGLTSSVNPSVFGQPIIFTATVTGSSGTPSGTITFKNGLTTLGTATLNGSGLATFSTSTLAVGSSYSITAEYGGDSSYVTSTCSAVSQVVNKASSATVLIAAPNPSVFGESVSFTALVTGSFGTPSGTITFKNGLTTLGTGTLNGSGVTTFSTSSLAVGSSYSITAEYGGDANFVTSTSSAVSQVVNKASSATVLIAAPNPSVFGESITFTALVTGSFGTPSGTITFKNGSTTLGTGTLNGSGVATFSTSSLAVGNAYSITAEYGGDSNFVTSTSSAVNQVVNKASSAIVLIAAPNPSVFGQSITFTATVAAVSPGAGTVAGTVEFFDGVTSLGTVTLVSGSATSAAITNFGVSTHSITAVYSGDASFVTSTSTAVSQVVNLATANTPTFGIPTSTADGFTVQISNYVGAFTYGGTATTGTVSISGAVVTVTGVAANTSSTATITTTQTNYANGSALVTATSNVAPTPPAPSPTTTPTTTPAPAPTGPMITGTPPPPASSGSSTVNLYDPATGQPMATGTAVPFPGFDGPITVVSGDFNNDGVADLVAGAGFGGGPAIAILDSQTGQVMEAFWAFDPAFTGGVFVAVQDTNGDGILDIIASAGPGGGPEVRIFNGANLNLLRSFYAYDQSFTGGVSVATIDFNNDGILDIVTGAGPDGAPHVKVYDGATNAILSQWYAYPASFTGGIFVAVGDIGNDGTFEVVTGAGPTGAPVVAVWDPFTGALLAQFMAYAESFTGGVRVAVNDGNGDGIADIITGAGPGGGPQVNVFSFPVLDLLFSFYSGEATNPGGVFVS